MEPLKRTERKPSPPVRTSGNTRKPTQKSWLSSNWLKGGILLLVFFIWAGIVAAVHTHKALPPGLSFEGKAYRAESVDFLYDLSYKKDGGYHQEQMIFDRVNQAIAEAKEFIVVDMFLYSGYYDNDQSFPPLSGQLTESLLEAKRRHPAMPIMVVSDEVNTTYGSHPSPELERLKAAGIEVVLTDTDPLRDSVPLYSAVWRMGFQWFGQSGKGWLPNPLADSAPKVTLRSYLKLFNVKANHRKVVATENTALVLSANPHDASFNNSNIGFQITGSKDFITEVVGTEQAASVMSGGPAQLLPKAADTLKEPARPKAASGNGTQEPAAPSRDAVTVRLLTEGKIYSRLLDGISAAPKGSEIRMGMFYLADRKVIDALLDASARGVSIQLLLDPNQNAFGHSKTGIPNRPVAAELRKKTDGKIAVKWYNTAQEQFHTKLIDIRHPDGSAVINGGSANFTPRNLDDLNLETNVEITAPAGSKITQDLDRYWDRLWNNRDAEYSLEYPAYEDKLVGFKRIVYHLQDMLGFTTY
ncbi:phospholipase D family protein [Paenibacillus chitinolyticus]|uniref:phospholipase D family protein n=1 Tax=Paenibacillus chitinolyticus TaxID=79263 RepID=UPI0036D7B2A8